MMEQNLFTELLIKFGLHIGLPHFGENGDNPARLVFDEKIIVNMVLGRDEENIQLFSPLGIVNPNNAEIIYKQILEANLFWRGTGGCTLGLSDEGNVILAYQVPLHHMDCLKLECLLSAFVDTADSWVEKLANITIQKEKKVPLNFYSHNTLMV